MNTIVNTVNLIGNLGKDVEVKIFESGSKKASASIATTEYRKNEKGELVTNTQWHNLTLWGRNAELFSKAMSKGTMVAVTGIISYRNYTDKAGVPQRATEILVSDFMRVAEPKREGSLVDPRPF